MCPPAGSVGDRPERFLSGHEAAQLGDDQFALLLREPVVGLGQLDEAAVWPAFDLVLEGLRRGDAVQLAYAS
jgi:hypothetical protein